MVALASHHPILSPTIISTLCSSLKGLGMLLVRAALLGQEWRWEGEPWVQQPFPHLSCFHSVYTQPSPTALCRSPWSGSIADRDSACLSVFPPLVADLPPVVLSASNPHCSPGKAQFLSHTKMLRSNMKFLLRGHFYTFPKR